MPANTEIRIPPVRLKEARLFEISLKRFDELEAGGKVNVNVNVITEAAFAQSEAGSDQFVIATLRWEIDISSASDAAKRLFARIHLAVQGVFTCATPKSEVTPQTKLDRESMNNLSDRLFPVAQQYLKRLLVEANLPALSLPWNMQEWQTTFPEQPAKNAASV